MRKAVALIVGLALVAGLTVLMAVASLGAPTCVNTGDIDPSLAGVLKVCVDDAAQTVTADSDAAGVHLYADGAGNICLNGTPVNGSCPA